MTIASVDLIPTEIIYGFVSDTKGEPLSLAFEEIGLEHHLILNNFGTLGFIFALLPFAYLLHLITKICNGVFCCQKFSNFLQKHLYFNFLIRLAI